jgi:hypothetical protein
MSQLQAWFENSSPPTYGDDYGRLQVPEEEDILDKLMRTLQQRAEDTKDKNTRQLFEEVRDELHKLNENLSGAQASEEQVAEHEDLSRRYPALKTRVPRPRRQPRAS